MAMSFVFNTSSVCDYWALESRFLQAQSRVKAQSGQSNGQTSRPWIALRISMDKLTAVIRWLPSTS